MSRWPAATVAERFWTKVDTSAGLFGCWLWTGGTNAHGYGLFYPTGRTVLAHRHVLGLVGRPVPSDREACHSCDNPPCVNPAHLFEGTHADNVADMVRKGRARGCPPRGERHHSARLTPDVVRALRLEAAEHGLNQTAVAVLYGVNQSTISKILLGKIWRDVA